MAINPAVISAYAEGDNNNLDNNSETTGPSKATRVSTNSTVSFTFNPTSANGAMTPVDATGEKAKINVTATVRVQNSGGYKVYVGSSSSQLRNGSNVIDSVSSDTTYENLPVNRWGYSFAQGTTASNTYKAMPATLRSAPLFSNSSTNIPDETKIYTLSFAANIGADKPAGTYSNQVTMSVVSSPLEVAGLASLTNMQDMTSSVCADSAVGDSAQLKDVRDGKYYWVSKLADGKCWMTQNLDLDLSTSTVLTSATSDVANNWTPGFNTATIVDSGTVNADSQTETRSWSLGDYRITDPDVSSNCGIGQASAASCPSQFTVYNTPTSANGDVNAHYILGNHYQWTAATAGGATSASPARATNSICPKGWRLPTGNSSGEFVALVAALGGTGATNNVTQSPFYGVRGGAVYQLTSYLFIGAGNEGIYWSSIPDSTYPTASYYLFFRNTNYVNPSDFNNWHFGYSIRCIAR